MTDTNSSAAADANVSASPGKAERFRLTTDEGRALAVYYALPGGIAGLLLHVIGETVWFDWNSAWFAFLGPLIVFGTGAWALVTEPEERRRSALLALALGTTLGGLSWSAYHFFGEEGAAHAAIVTPVLGWIALAFYRSRQGSRDGGYPEIFAQAWNLPVLLFVAQIFTWGTYGVLWLLGAMFRLIGIPLLTDALSEPWFSLPVIGALMASGIAVTRRQEAILLSLRAVLFGLLRVVAPVFAFGTLLFSFALLFQGLDTLWAGWSPVILLVSTLTAGVVFINAVVQDDEGPGGLLGITARVQAVVLPVLAGLAAYGMVVRIGEYGLSPQRIVAAIIAAFSLAYAGTYAVAGALGRWAVLRRGNIALAAALAVVMAYTLTPLFLAQSWSTADQVARLDRGAVSPEDFDYAALRFDFGEPGQAALTKLAESDDETIASNAQAVLDADYRWDVANDGQTEADKLFRPEAEGGAAVRPVGADLPEGFVAAVRDRGYYEDGEEAALLVMPAYDGEHDAVLALSRSNSWVRIRLWMETGADSPVGEADWSYRAEFDRGFGTDEEAEAFMATARNGAFGPVPITLIAPQIGGMTLRVEEGRSRYVEPAKTPAETPSPD